MKKHALTLLSLSIALLSSCTVSEPTEPDKPIEVEPVYSYVFNSDSPVKLQALSGQTNTYKISDLAFEVNDTIKFVNSAKNPYEVITDINITGNRQGFSFTDGAFKASQGGIYSFTGVFSITNYTISIDKKEEPVVNKYTVSFNLMGHGPQIEALKDVDEGSKISKPTDPTADGYIFEGWYKESSCKNAWNFNVDTVTTDVTLYAKWSLAPVEKYIVTFDTQGHGVAPDNITNVEKGSKISKPTDPTEDGYTFMGWYKESSCVNEWRFNVDIVVKNTTLFAKWEETQVKYFVVFSNTAKAYDINYGVELTLLDKDCYQAEIDSSYMQTSVIVHVVDTDNNIYTCYNTTTNAFRDYRVKSATNGIQVVLTGTYTFTLDISDKTSGLSVVCESTVKYMLYETRAAGNDFVYFNYVSATSTEITYNYLNLDIMTYKNASYSIRQYIDEKYVIKEIKLSGRTSTKKFTLNGTSFTYDNSSAIGKEKFDFTLTLNVSDLSLELDIVLH